MPFCQCPSNHVIYCVSLAAEIAPDLQGHALSRFHAASASGEPESDISHPVTALATNQIPSAAGSVEMADISDPSDVPARKAPKDDSGLRHVHMAGDTEQGRHHNGEPDLWASMLKRKIGADPDMMGRVGSETSEEDVGTARTDSQAALLGLDQVSSSGVGVLHSPPHHMAHPATSALHHQGPLQQPSTEQPLSEAQEPLSGFRRLGRLLMHTAHLAPHSSSMLPEHQLPQGDPNLLGGSPQQAVQKSMWHRVGQSTRIMAAFKKKTGDAVEGEPGGGVGSGPPRLGLQEASSAASNFPLLPAGMPYGESLTHTVCENISQPEACNTLPFSSCLLHYISRLQSAWPCCEPYSAGAPCAATEPMHSIVYPSLV